MLEAYCEALLAGATKALFEASVLAAAVASVISSTQDTILENTCCA